MYDLLPAVPDYVAYSGSLTTPPCSEVGFYTQESSGALWGVDDDAPPCFPILDPVRYIGATPPIPTLPLAEGVEVLDAPHHHRG